MECNHIDRRNLAWHQRAFDRFHRFLHHLYSGNSDRTLLHMNSSDTCQTLPRRPPLFETVLSSTCTNQDEAARTLSEVVQKELLLQIGSSASVIGELPAPGAGCKSLEEQVFNELGSYAGRRVTAFHLAVLRDDITMAKALHTLNPSYLSWSSGDGMFSGESALHVAVVNAAQSPYWSAFDDLEGTSGTVAGVSLRRPVFPGDGDMLVFLADLITKDAENGGSEHNLDILNSAKVNGPYFSSDSEFNQVQWGDTPLSFATCLRLPRVVAYLASRGADLFVLDSKGNNLLHLLAQQIASGKQSVEATDSDVDTAQHPMRTVPCLAHVCQYIKTLACEQRGCNHGKHDFHCLETQLNKEGFTPLHVAAQSGNQEVFLYLANSPARRHELISYGGTQTIAYCTQDLDTPVSHAPQPTQRQRQRLDAANGASGSASAEQLLCDQDKQVVRGPPPNMDVATSRETVSMDMDAESPERTAASPAARTRSMDMECLQRNARTFPRTVMEVIVSSGKPQVWQLLNTTPMRQLVDVKWMQYGFFGYTLLLTYNLLYVLVLSLVIFYRPVKLSMCSADVTADVTDDVTDGADVAATTNASELFPCSPFVKRKGSDAYESTEDYIRLVGEIVVLVNTVLQIALEISDFRRFGFKILVYELVSRGSWFTAFKCMNLLLVLLAVILRLAGSDYEDIVLMWTVLMAWAYALMYGRCIKPLGHYLLSLKQVLEGDIPKFCFIFLHTVIGFSIVFYLIFQEASPSTPIKFSGFWQTMLTLFRMSLGLTDIEISEMRQTKASGWVAVYIILFLIMSYLLLINFLIATMQHRHDNLMQRTDLIWRLLVTSSIIFIERRLWRILPSKRMRIGRRGEELGLRPGSRYLCISQQCGQQPHVQLQ